MHDEQEGRLVFGRLMKVDRKEGVSGKVERAKEKRERDERCSSVEIPEEQIRRLIRGQSFDVAVGS